MQKRFQVFVSSTFRDLQVERSKIIRVLLEMNCIPTGMEMFPAANDDAWTWIKKCIEESDYYVVLVAGRYGSISESTGLAYTEMEYSYAVKIGKPVIAFLHGNPDRLPERRKEATSEAREKLSAFRKLTERKLCKYWKNADELGQQLAVSLPQLFAQYPATGWVRSDSLPDRTPKAEELVNLENQVRDLKARLAKGTADKALEHVVATIDERQVLFSIRGKIASGERGMIIGLIITGRRRKLFVRCLGQSLEKFGVRDAAQSPSIMLTFLDGRRIAVSEPIFSSKTIAGAEAAKLTLEFGLVPLADNSRDAVVVADVEPGIYTLIVENRNGVEGAVNIDACQRSYP